MTFLITEACIKCKYMDCISVCPVDCFHEGENMLVISPDECIDCGLCEPECPVEAIKSDTESGLEKWRELNAAYAAIWPNIRAKGEPPANADQVKGDFEHPLTKGYSCPKGRAIGQVRHLANPITEPLMRKNGELVPVSWDEALNDV